jgi:hypothetical protein
MRNDEYGEVIFPIVSEVSDPWSDDCGNCLYLKEEIRDEYFSEIKNILNGYDDHFLEYFSRIKGILPSNGKGSWYEWLNLKEAKAVIKKWEGDPLDVLYYLTNAKIIEKAVNCEFYKRNRK